MRQAEPDGRPLGVPLTHMIQCLGASWIFESLVPHSWASRSVIAAEPIDLDLAESVYGYAPERRSPPTRPAAPSPLGSRRPAGRPPARARGALRPVLFAALPRDPAAPQGAPALHASLRRLAVGERERPPCRKGPMRYMPSPCLARPSRKLRGTPNPPRQLCGLHSRCYKQARRIL